MQFKRLHGKLGICAILFFLIPTIAFGNDKYESLKKLLEDGQYELALSEIKTLAENGPVPVRELLELSRILEANDYIPVGISLLEKQRVHYNDSLQVLERLAQLYIESNQSNKAIGIYEDLVRLDRNRRQYWLQLGQLCSWNEKSVRAMEAYEQAASLDPTDTNTLSQLRQLYLWNEHPKRAYQIEKVLLRREPSNLELWKQHGMQAIWLGKNEEAIDAFKNILKQDPANVEAFFLLGETALWSNRHREAEISLGQVLKMQPQNEQARFYLAQLKQWKPFGWRTAKDYYEHILKENPSHEESKKQLTLIRKEYNPLFNSRAKYTDDSNGLKKTEVSALQNQYVTAHWEFEAETIYRRLEEKTSAGRLLYNGEGLRLGGIWHVSPRVQVIGNGGFVHFNVGKAFGLGKIQVQQTLSNKKSWPGQLTTSTFLKFDNVMDGVLAIKQEFTGKSLGQNVFWTISPSITLSGELEHSWYSDDNRKVEINSEGQFRFHSGPPSFYLTAVYSYLDMRLYYPDSEPYWTPQDFWTRALGLSGKFLLGRKASLTVGHALTEQTGHKFANNWKVDVSWQPNDYTQLQIAYQDFGSQFYSYRSFAGQFSYRW